MSTLPAPRRNTRWAVANWERAYRELRKNPDQWVLLAASVPVEVITRLRAGKIGPLEPLHPNVEYALRESHYSRTQSRYVGRLWAYYSPGRESAHSIHARFRQDADAAAARIAPTYPDIPKIEDL